MKKLLLMRHAKSSWEDHSLDDFDRPLSKRGRVDVIKMAQWLRERNCIPDIIISSSARRTHETACGLIFILQSEHTILRESRRLYLSDINTHIEILHDLTNGTETVMLIGHNPTLDNLVEFLSREKPAYSDEGKLMTTGSIACLEPAGNIHTMGKGSFQLAMLQRPKEL